MGISEESIVKELRALARVLVMDRTEADIIARDALLEVLNTGAAGERGNMRSLWDIKRSLIRAVCRKCGPICGNQRIALVLAEVLMLEERQIAAMVGCNVSSVESLISGAVAAIN